jgi:hypothetical protein
MGNHVVTCIHCKQPIGHVDGVWVDHTDGDGCGDNGDAYGHGVHEPNHLRRFGRWLDRVFTPEVLDAARQRQRQIEDQTRLF